MTRDIITLHAGLALLEYFFRAGPFTGGKQ
jgi:hypothetical protein